MRKQAAGLALVAAVASSKYVDFNVTDTTEQPMDFKDGLPVFVSVSYQDQNDVDEDLDNFLLCTSCTISYVFADVPTGVESTSEEMTFVKNKGKVTVNFATAAL